VVRQQRVHQRRVWLQLVKLLRVQMHLRVEKMLVQILLGRVPLLGRELEQHFQEQRLLGQNLQLRVRNLQLRVLERQRQGWM
jgi:hypothetical protein